MRGIKRILLAVKLCRCPGYDSRVVPWRKKQQMSHHDLLCLSYLKHGPSKNRIEPLEIRTYTSNMKNVDWQDLNFFLAVARTGSLSGAAVHLLSSPATVGRRILALEQAMARQLFVRKQTGYDLTQDGSTLLVKVKAMEAGARPVLDWLNGDAARPVVRISAGTWTAQFLCANIGRLWQADDPFGLAFMTTERRLDIGHREADIGLRSHPSDGINLATRRTGAVAHGVFRARNLPAARHGDWVSILPEDATTAATRWANEQPGLRIAGWANSPRTLRDMILAGVGQGVLPCFAGDLDPDLERVGPPLSELDQEQWLVMHNDDRHRPDVRRVLDRLGALLDDHAPLFQGARPMGNPA
jgi:DNA-binding transcriptional LysR family regulator